MLVADSEKNSAITENGIRNQTLFFVFSLENGKFGIENEFMRILFTNIKELIQVRDEEIERINGLEMGNLPTIKNAWLCIENDLIADFGEMDNFQLEESTFDEVIDAKGKLLMPTWCDSHSHLVFAESREGEFVDRINGLTYEEIAAKGGGILNSAEKLANKAEDELYEDALARLKDLVKLGTGAIEIKSGYGLSTEAELKMLRVIKKLKQNTDVAIKATFLGAHAIPKSHKQNGEAYLALILDEMLPKVAAEKLADYIDAFCEKNYFTAEETERIIKAGAKYSLKAKIHVNQFNSIGGIGVCTKNNALSVDHLESMEVEDLIALEESNTIATALPSCSFFLGIPYAPAKEMMKRNICLALASDFNPGSTPSGNMNFVVSLACIKQKMTPEEAINAATINGAAAMELGKTHGSISKGKKANLILTKEIPSYAFIPYAFGSNLIDKVFINGRLQ